MRLSHNYAFMQGIVASAGWIILGVLGWHGEVSLSCVYLITFSYPLQATPADNYFPIANMLTGHVTVNSATEHQLSWVLLRSCCACV